jgi:hypothetical protein
MTSHQHQSKLSSHTEAKKLLRGYEERLVAAIKKETGTGLEAMYNRSREISMRLSLIIARSMGQDEIGADAMQWSIDYVNYYAKQTIEMFRSNMANGPFDAACKAVYARIEKAGLAGLTERDLSRSVSAFANMDQAQTCGCPGRTTDRPWHRVPRSKPRGQRQATFRIFCTTLKLIRH